MRFIVITPIHVDVLANHRVAILLRAYPVPSSSRQLPTLGRRPSADLRARVVMTDAAEETPKGEKKPKDVTTAILERKKAPNRLIVGASREDFHLHARSR